ncbi:MAG TPA: S8 family serine peptidase, partial [Solirubrobacterales bacterium]|nr:S8 family serine peptidase [Solirubrobacterales bacterium]
MNRFAGTALLVLTILLGAVTTASAARDFWNPASSDSSQQFPLLPPPLDGNVQRDDTPNDPGYDRAEPDDEDGATTTNIYDERFDLFGFPSSHTALTLYREGPNALKKQISGFNAAGAWKISRGSPEVAIAVLDTGIKWDREGIRLQVRLNRNELPQPQTAGGSSCAYDCNGDGAFNVADYNDDPRISHTAGPHGSAQIDAEDLITVFSDGTDSDANGYVDDIAGWDFFDNDNNPYDASSYFAASGHGSGRMTEAVERGDDGQGEIGVCPGCQILPIRTWDTFVADGNTVGMGMLYATDAGAKVIVAANGSIYHSAFAEAASRYAYENGVVQTYSGDDLNTANHNYPANYGHAMLIQGVVTDTQGLGTDVGPELRSALCGDLLSPLGVCLGTELPVGTYFRGANTTQFGGKSSIAMEGATGSENTGKAGGAAGLVISAALQHGITLRPDETRAILEQTAERVTGSALNPLSNVAGLGTADPGADPAAAREDQWTSHFGWGRVNLGEAVRVASDPAATPPEAMIDSPDWYAPINSDSIELTGLARARAATGTSFSWRLEWGPGQAPTAWNEVASGTGSGSGITDLGSLDMNEVRDAMASYDAPADSGGPTFSTSGANPHDHEFTVRLVVTGSGIATPGIDRRVFTLADDPDLRDGFPKRLGTGGEAPVRYADLDQDGVQELIVPLMDGTVHAFRPDGSELPGWPVETRLMRNADGHAAADGFAALAGETPPREPPRGPAVADIDGDGAPEVVTTAGIRVYAWESSGEEVNGF